MIALGGNKMRFIFYQKLMEDPIIEKVLRLKEADDDELYQEIVSELLAQAYTLEIDGDIFKRFICYKIVTDENAFTLSAEKQGGKVDSVLKELARYYEA